MTDKAPKAIRIECIVNPDVHLGDGRVLKGPIKEGTKTIVHGDVAEVPADLGEFLVERGQVHATKRDVTVHELD
jgi:hypothetical protein